MKLKNGAEHMDSLKNLNPKIYCKGKRIEDVTTHPATAPHVWAAAMTILPSNGQDHRPIYPCSSRLGR